MKATTSMILLLLLVLVYSGCKRKAYYDLAITLDSTFSFRLLDSITLSSKSFSSTVHFYDTTCWSFDTINQSTTLYWDSLTSAEYVFRLKTLFTRTQTLKFSLSSDTAFHLKNELDIYQVNMIDYNELLKADTIEFVYTSDGCFHSYFEKSILVKDKVNNNYNIKTISNKIRAEDEPLDINQMMPSDIIDTLFQVQFDWKKQKDKLEKSGNYYFSTTTQCFYLLAKSKLFYFNDQGLGGWKWELYHKVKIGVTQPPMRYLEFIGDTLNSN